MKESIKELDSDISLLAGINIRAKRKELKMSSNKLGALVNTDGAYIRQMEKGTRRFTLDMINRISKALNYDIGEILTKPIPLEIKRDMPIQLRKDVHMLKVFVGVPCGDFSKMDDEVVDYWPTTGNMLAGIDHPSLNSFWVQVNGDSMSPIINNGNMVLVASSYAVEIQDGDLVIFVRDSTATLKRFYYDETSINLIPENSHKYKPIKLTIDEIEGQHIIMYKVLWVANKL